MTAFIAVVTDEQKKEWTQKDFSHNEDVALLLTWK